MKRHWWALCTLALAACATTAEPERSAEWKVAVRVDDGAVASVWGTSASDVWAAGGRSGKGLVLHFDGKTWATVDDQPPGFVWWIYGSGAKDVYAAGEHGLVRHFDGERWSAVAAHTDATLYGLWVAPSGEVWAVGGNPDGQPGEAVILQGNALGLAPVLIPKELLPSVLYKIYGSPEGGVVAVGKDGTVLRRRTTGQWQRDAVPTADALVSLWGGGGQRLYAVGGDALGILLDYDGQQWRPVDGLQPGLQLSGVFAAPGQPVLAVGAGPRIVELEAKRAPTEVELTGVSGSEQLHAVWGDGHGLAFAVGGTLLGDPTAMTGVILHRQ
jgi:hypothetical protein